jgi:hypothetical protein
MDMIDRGAAAILRALVGGGDEVWNSLPEKSRDYYRVQSRAAIEAMRELPENPGPRYDAGEYSRRTQEAMVDDALTPSLEKA